MGDGCSSLVYPLGRSRRKGRYETRTIIISINIKMNPETSRNLFAEEHYQREKILSAQRAERDYKQWTWHILFILPLENSICTLKEKT